MDPKAALAGAGAVLALATLIVTLAHEDREPAIPMAIGLIGLVSLLVAWPKISKWHAIAAFALLGGAAGYLFGGGFSSFAKVVSLYLIASTFALVWHLGRREKQAREAATQ